MHITLFIKLKEKYFLLMQIFVNDILFGATDESLMQIKAQFRTLSPRMG